MSQHIGINIVNENNKIIRGSDINLSKFMYVFYEAVKDKDKFKMVMSIDPYGNTLFNKKQTNFLKEDLLVLKGVVVLSDFLGTIDSLLELCSLVEIHDYLLFTGD